MNLRLNLETRIVKGRARGDNCSCCKSVISGECDVVEFNIERRGWSSSEMFICESCEHYFDDYKKSSVEEIKD